jgi:hypothetical protein
MATTRFSPREFLKGRRPERFSDSERLDEPVLDRSLLEYHLHTLTNRSQEKDFAFSRSMASARNRQSHRVDWGEAPISRAGYTRASDRPLGV